MRAALRLDPGHFEAQRFLALPKFLRTMAPEHRQELERLAPRSRAQLYQDLFALAELGYKHGGFFVEIGVGDGERLSNTWLLEKDFGWRGLLAEPNRAMTSRIRACRSAVLDTRAVWNASGESLAFTDVTDLRELSTLTRYRDADAYTREGTEYPVETVTLNDLLDAHGAPTDIDYLSLDTEGSEWEILRGLDFARHRVRVFTIEHNFDATRLAAISELLGRHGYRRVHERFARYDAWFVRP